MSIAASDGLRVLVVEDEALIAMMAEDMLDLAGHVVARSAATLADALAAAGAGDFDVAMLDVNLNGDDSMPVATVLKARGVPFLFTTGYGSNGIGEGHDDIPVLTKPYGAAELEAALRACVARQAAGTSSITSSIDSNRG